MIFKFKRLILCLFVLIVSLVCVYPAYASVSGDAVKLMVRHIGLHLVKI